MLRPILCTSLILAFACGLYISSVEQAPILPSPVPIERSWGASIQERPIKAYEFGHGPYELVIVGGMHGGYEWNTSLLAYELLEYFTSDPERIPEHIRLTIIPVANPDGLHMVAGTTTDLSLVSFPSDPNARFHGRFNANGVDLNRNFACRWEPTSTWGMQEVSAGSHVFSEPEAQALQRLVEDRSPQAFIFLHSRANAVYGSECEEGVLQETKELLEAYAVASGYRPIELFDSYPIAGDAEGWLASLGIPAITVELADHENTEFERNLRGVEAVMRWMGEGQL